MEVPIASWWAQEGVKAIAEVMPALSPPHRYRLALLRVHLLTRLEEAARSGEAAARTRVVTCPRCSGKLYEAVECADGTYRTRCLLCNGQGVVDHAVARALRAALAADGGQE